jgi:hypothetical protein
MLIRPERRRVSTMVDREKLLMSRAKKQTEKSSLCLT